MSLENADPHAVDVVHEDIDSRSFVVEKQILNIAIQKNLYKRKYPI